MCLLHYRIMVRGGIEMKPPIPVKCPKCGCDDISASDWESGTDSASCKVDCQECDFRWYEYYKAVSWEDGNRPSGRHDLWEESK